jgi:hypothetical protein
MLHWLNLLVVRAPYVCSFQSYLWLLLVVLMNPVFFLKIVEMASSISHMKHLKTEKLQYKKANTMIPRLTLCEASFKVL